MTAKDFDQELENFKRSWKIIEYKIQWLHHHYYDSRNRGNEGKIETRTDLILIQDHLKEMQQILDKWKLDFP